MGEDAAAEIVKNFDDNERELVCVEMANLPLLDSQQQGEVLQEFTEMAVKPGAGLAVRLIYSVCTREIRGPVQGGRNYRSSRHGSNQCASMQQIIDLDATSIMNLLKEEDAQTIASYSVTFLQPKARKC